VTNLVISGTKIIDGKDVAVTDQVDITNQLLAGTNINANLPDILKQNSSYKAYIKASGRDTTQNIDHNQLVFTYKTSKFNGSIQ